MEDISNDVGNAWWAGLTPWHKTIVLYFNYAPSILPELFAALLIYAVLGVLLKRHFHFVITGILAFLGLTVIGPVIERPPTTWQQLWVWLFFTVPGVIVSGFLATEIYRTYKPAFRAAFNEISGSIQRAANDLGQAELPFGQRSPSPAPHARPPEASQPATATASEMPRTTPTGAPVKFRPPPPNRSK